MIAQDVFDSIHHHLATTANTEERFHEALAAIPLGAKLYALKSVGVEVPEKTALWKANREQWSHMAQEIEAAWNTLDEETKLTALYNLPVADEDEISDRLTNDPTFIY